MIQQKRHYNFLCREIKRQSQLDKDSYLRSLCEQVEKAHMQKKSKELWTKSVVVPIHMKRDKLSCDNYRGVSLLSHCGKVMTNIILQRIRLRRLFFKNGSSYMSAVN